MRDVIAAVCLIAGASFALTAAIGLVRFPDVLTRMHAATKPQTLGLLLVLTGLSVRLGTVSAISTVVVVGTFALLTAPVAAHMVGRAAFRKGLADRSRLVRDDLSDEPSE